MSSDATRQAVTRLLARAMAWTATSPAAVSTLGTISVLPVGIASRRSWSVIARSSSTICSCATVLGSSTASGRAWITTARSFLPSAASGFTRTAATMPRLRAFSSSPRIISRARGRSGGGVKSSRSGTITSGCASSAAAWAAASAPATKSQVRRRLGGRRFGAWSRACEWGMHTSGYSRPRQRFAASRYHMPVASHAI